MSMAVSGFKNRSYLVPLMPGERLDLRIKCDACQTNFSVVGSAFFCPSCGVSSATRVFEDAMRKIRIKLETATRLPSIVGDGGSRDDIELLGRSLVETSLTDCVVAFQRLAEELYRLRPGAGTPPMNVFQRLDDGSQLWLQETGEGYQQWLTQAEVDLLRLQFQRRHLLQHTDGVVDQRYLTRSGDTRYKIGQRIVVRADDVRQLGRLIEKLAANLRRVCGVA